MSSWLTSSPRVNHNLSIIVILISFIFGAHSELEKRIRKWSNREARRWLGLPPSWPCTPRLIYGVAECPNRQIKSQKGKKVKWRQDQIFGITRKIQTWLFLLRFYSKRHTIASSSIEKNWIWLIQGRFEKKTRLWKKKSFLFSPERKKWRVAWFGFIFIFSLLWLQSLRVQFDFNRLFFTSPNDSPSLWIFIESNLKKTKGFSCLWTSWERELIKSS